MTIFICLTEMVYNDFYIGEDCDVTIIAGCGIHTNKHNAKHNGIHCLHIGNNCNVKYIERHIGLGVRTSQKELSDNNIHWFVICHFSN